MLRSLSPIVWMIVALVPAVLGTRRGIHLSRVEAGPDTARAAVPATTRPAPATATVTVTDPSTFETKVPATRTARLTALETREAAASDTGLRIVVSLAHRRLWVLQEQDTLRSAPVAVGMDERLDFDGRVWVFRTPVGVRTVLEKRSSPVWVPPDWHYAEVAREYGLAIQELHPDIPVPLRDGRWLELRDGEAGLIGADSVFAPLPTDEEIVFDSTLYVPPVGSKNRRIEGELGVYQLDMGNGYLLHGTPHTESIGTATTHGCVRLHDRDIEWLYDNVPVGTKVYIY